MRRLAYGVLAHQGEVAADLFQVVPAEKRFFAEIRAPSHD